MKNINLIKIIIFSSAAISAACLAFIIYVVFLASPIQKASNAILKASTIEPESFTELYFEKHNTELPKLLAYQGQFEWYSNPKTNLYTFSFTINNLENKDMNYSYEVYSFDGNTKASIDEGKVFIKKNESKTIAENFSLPSNYLRTKVIVNLIDQKQQISFWMEAPKQ